MLKKQVATSSLGHRVLNTPLVQTSATAGLYMIAPIVMLAGYAKNNTSDFVLLALVSAVIYRATHSGS